MAANASSADVGVMNATEECNLTTCDDDVHYMHPLLYRLVGTVCVGVIFVVGLTGNALVVAVVVRVPAMRSPTNWYLVSLALADVVLLVSAPLPTLVEYHVVVDRSVSYLSYHIIHLAGSMMRCCNHKTLCRCRGTARRATNTKYRI